MANDERKNIYGASIGGVVVIVVGIVLLVLFEAFGILCIIAGRKYALFQNLPGTGIAIPPVS